MGLSAASKRLLFRKTQDERLKGMGYDPEKFRNLKAIKEAESRYKMFESAKKGLMSAGEYNLRLKNLRSRRRNKK